MANPVIYGPKYSTYVRSVLLALEEKGAAYEVKEVDILKGEHQSPDFISRQPFAKVPAFSHDGFDLYETGAILQYVDASFDGRKLQPDDVRSRARMHQVMSIIDAYAYPAFITNIFIPRVVVPMLGDETDENAIAEALPNAEKSVNALETIIGSNPCVAGDELSLGDLHLVPVYDYFSQTPEGEKILAGAPNLRRWWDSFSARESVRKTRPQLG
jgi:glutathione S-transferase